MQIEDDDVELTMTEIESSEVVEENKTKNGKKLFLIKKLTYILSIIFISSIIASTRFLIPMQVGFKNQTTNFYNNVTAFVTQNNVDPFL